jgi:alcohol dehydrogenase YqhD (iron-dependent ADH family)
MWQRIQTLTIDDLEKLSEEEQKEIEEYKDPVIEEIDNRESDNIEEEINAVKEFWNNNGGENGEQD